MDKKSLTAFQSIYGNKTIFFLSSDNNKTMKIRLKERKFQLLKAIPTIK